MKLLKRRRIIIASQMYIAMDMENYRELIANLTNHWKLIKTFNVIYILQ